MDPITLTANRTKTNMTISITDTVLSTLSTLKEQNQNLTTNIKLSSPFTSQTQNNATFNSSWLSTNSTPITNLIENYSSTVQTTIPNNLAGLIFNLNQTDSDNAISSVFAIVLLEDNLIACSKESTLFIADYSSGLIKFQTSPHKNEIRALVSLKNNIFASGSDDSTIKIWNATSNECLFTFNSSNGGHTSYVRLLTALGNNLLISGASQDPNLKVWNVLTGTLIMTLNNGFSIQALVSLKNEIYFATGSSQEIRIWNVLTGTLIGNPLKSGNVFSLAPINSRSDLLACGDLNGAVSLWNISSGSLLFKSKGHNSRVSFLLSLENNLLASIDVSFVSSIQIWNLTSGQIKYTFDKTNGGHTGTISSLSSLENNLLASGGAGDFDIRIWDLNVGILKHRFNRSSGGHCQTVKVLTPLGGNLLASGGDRGSWGGPGNTFDGSVKIWRVF